MKGFLRYLANVALLSMPILLVFALLHYHWHKPQHHRVPPPVVIEQAAPAVEPTPPPVIEQSVPAASSKENSAKILQAVGKPHRPAPHKKPQAKPAPEPQPKAPPPTQPKPQPAKPKPRPPQGPHRTCDANGYCWMYF